MVEGTNNIKMISLNWKLPNLTPHKKIKDAVNVMIKITDKNDSLF